MPVLLLLLLFTAPVKFTLLYDQALTLDVRIWGLGRSWQPHFTAGMPAQPKSLLRSLGTLLRSNHARRLFRMDSQLRLQALLRLGLDDAARTALLTGLLQQAARFLPHQADIRIQPDFLGRTRLQARCILFTHLGTLLITAAMLLTAYLLEGREHPQPQPKEA
ncbi:MAG: DUF2953 domain-containing protein [Clostridia bacterium]|nr:DUF2953 domain-containing protein [Clostridia bacterium]